MQTWKNDVKMNMMMMKQICAEHSKFPKYFDHDCLTIFYLL